MSDDFCLEHGYEHMRCDKVWGAIPYCEACELAKVQPDVMKMHDETMQRLKDWIEPETKCRTFYDRNLGSFTSTKSDLSDLGGPYFEAAHATIDDDIGMAWWNHLGDLAREKWAKVAGTGRAKDAWEAYKKATLTSYHEHSASEKGRLK